MAIILVIKIPKALDNAVDTAVKQNQKFAHAYNTCEIQLEAEHYSSALTCFKDLLQQYDRNDIRYNYAVCLANTQKFEEAKKELNYIIETEKNNPQLVEVSKNLISQIDELLLKIKKIKEMQSAK